MTPISPANTSHLDTTSTSKRDITSDSRLQAEIMLGGKALLVLGLMMAGTMLWDLASASPACS